MTRASRTAVIILVTMAAVLAACATDAQGTASASASPPEWKRVTSERFGYSLEVPGTFEHTAATEDWPAGVYPVADAPYTDLWFDPVHFPTIDIVTQEMPDELSEAEFLAWLDENNAERCTVEETEEITVAGTVGRWQDQTCGYNSMEVVLFDDGWVYVLWWLGNVVDADADRERFEHVLSTFEFPGD